MKPFSLEEYLKNPSRKVVTRDNRNVRIVCTDKRGRNRPIIALIEEQDNVDEVYMFKKDGSWDASGEESINDLCFAPERHEGWANIFNVDGCKHLDHKIYESKEDAEKEGKFWSFYVSTIKVEWEE